MQNRRNESAECLEKGIAMRTVNNNRGSSMILVLAVVSMVMMMSFGVMSSSLAVTRISRRSWESDENFYRLEAALDEICAGAGMYSSEIMKRHYAEVLEKLYQADGYTDNRSANEAFCEAVIGELDADMGECGEAENLLRQFLVTLPEENLSVRVGETVRETEGSGVFRIRNLCLTYTDDGKGEKPSLTVDLVIRVPYLHFLDGDDTPSTAPGDYSDFVGFENWRRGMSREESS